MKISNVLETKAIEIEETEELSKIQKDEVIESEDSFFSADMSSDDQNYGATGKQTETDTEYDCLLDMSDESEYIYVF